MLIVNIIVDPEYPSQCLREMNKIFEEIIDNKEFIKDKTIMRDFTNLLASKLKNGLIQKNSYKSIAYIFENVLSSKTIDSSNCEYFIELVLDCAEKMLKDVIDILGKININEVSNKDKEIENNILYYIETVKIIYELSLLISIISLKFVIYGKIGDINKTVLIPFSCNSFKVFNLSWIELALSISFLKFSFKVFIDIETVKFFIFFNKSKSLNINFDFVEILNSHSTFTNCSNMFLVIQ